MTVLDVGCGTSPVGDVNCDLFVKKTIHRGYDTSLSFRDKILVCCSSEYLPFSNKSFDFTYSKELLEHVDDPLKTLRELIRVTKKRLLIIVPHRYLRYKWSSLKYNQHPNDGKVLVHKTLFDEHTLRQLIMYASPNTWFYVQIRKRRPFRYLPVTFPHMIYAEIRLDRKVSDYTLPLSKNFIEHISGIDVTWEPYKS